MTPGLGPGLGTAAIGPLILPAINGRIIMPREVGRHGDRVYAPTTNRREENP